MKFEIIFCSLLSTSCYALGFYIGRASYKTKFNHLKSAIIIAVAPFLISGCAHKKIGSINEPENCVYDGESMQCVEKKPFDQCEGRTDSLNNIMTYPQCDKDGQTEFGQNLLKSSVSPTPGS